MTIRKFLIISSLVFVAILLNLSQLSASKGYQVKTFQKGHEIRLGIGAYDIYTLSETIVGCGCMSLRGWYKNNYGQHIYDYDGGGFGSVEDRMNSYKGPLKTTGTIQLSYNYRINRWFEFSLYGTYTGFLQKHYSVVDRSVVERSSESVIGLMPNIRITWVNKPAFRFYSGFGLGIAAILAGSDSSDAIPMININLLGFSFGRKIYGFAEYSIGSLGLISAGVGYKF